MSSVREALVTSVTWCPARAAGQVPDHPGVERAEQQLAGLGRGAAPGRCRGSRRPSMPRNTSSSGRPGLRAVGAALALSASHNRAVRVLPDDRVGDRPSRGRSQSTVVSRWLVTPMAAVGRADAGARRVPTRSPLRCSSRSPPGRARPSPARGKICSCSRLTETMACRGVEDDRARRRRALIDGQHVVGHRRPPSSRAAPPERSPASARCARLSR